MTANIATVDDVRRMSGLTVTAASDETVGLALESVTDWFVHIADGRWMDGAGTEVFGNPKHNDLLPLPVPDAIVHEVRMYSYGSLIVRFTDPNDWQVIDGHIVQVFGAGVTGSVDGRYAASSPYALGLIRRGLSRTEVDWTYTAGIPPAVRDGVALTAGALVRRGSNEASNMQSERIGDYSYVLNTKPRVFTNLVETMSPMGYALLKPWVLRPVVVT